MSRSPKVSVIVVSRDRDQSLKKLLLALRYQVDIAFELVIVTNSKPDMFLPTGVSVKDIKFVPFEMENISSARNAGLGVASGDIVAFCDDDCIPEPSWLARLTDPFKHPQVGISGGYVRARNGISFQWTQMNTSITGEDTPVRSDNPEPQIYDFDPEGFQKVQGTNCAFRKTALEQVGGFDEAFRFFLDETDLCLRLGRAGWKTAIVPLAEVQHGFAESSRRAKSRAPRSLYTEAASKAYFLKRHAPQTQHQPSIDRFLEDQKRRLIRLMITGWLGPTEVHKLMADAKIGLCDGFLIKETQFQTLAAIDTRQTIYPVFERASGHLLFGRYRDRKTLFALAEKSARQGLRVTAFCFSGTSLFHRRWFHEKGFWVQSGGVFGKSVRNDTLFRRFSFLERVAREKSLLTNTREFNSETNVSKWGP